MVSSMFGSAVVNIYGVAGGSGYIMTDLTDYSVIAGTWAVDSGASYWHGCLIYNSTGTQDDQVDFEVWLGAGVYDFSFLVTKDSDKAEVHLLVDSVDVGDFDAYDAGGTSYNNRFDIPAISIASEGLHTISLKASDKNVGSSAYSMGIGLMTIKRVA